MVRRHPHRGASKRALPTVGIRDSAAHQRIPLTSNPAERWVPQLAGAIAFLFSFHRYVGMWYSPEFCNLGCMSNPLTMPAHLRTADDGSAARKAIPPATYIRSLKRTPCVTAVESVEMLEGCTRPFLMRCDDGNLYAVKFSSNPYGPRILVNEYLATHLCREMGLAVPEIALVQVLAGTGHDPGLHFGSRIKRIRGTSDAHTWLPESVWGLVQNKADLIGAYVFDSWTGNTDQREIIFTRQSGPAPFRLFLIDSSHCFGANVWRHHGGTTPCPTIMRFAYRGVTSWVDLDPWLTAIERINPTQIESIAASVPSQWLPGTERYALDAIAADLIQRRLTMRSQISVTLSRGEHPFTCWRYGATPFAVPGLPSFGKTA